MSKNEFKILYAIKKYGKKYLEDDNLNCISKEQIINIINSFTKKGWIIDFEITEMGIKVLEPYKVDNAIIMAAGMSSRFVPLALEKPKGLLKVKDEILIERQIKQLKKAGIDEIILVLGYKKESFFYLAEKYDNIKIIINPEYNTKNNTHTLYLAQNYLRNSYICSSDNYFEENPFDEYVYDSYYSSIHVDEKTNEWYMISDNDGYIKRVNKTGYDGFIMLGHAYWSKRFSKKMVEILNEDYSVGNYDADLWEQVLADNINILPKMEIMVYPNDLVFEFDSLDELRQFDDYYVNHTHSKIINNIMRVLNCNESDIINFKPIKEGLTNTSFIFEVNGTKYVYRHPGEGTDAIISRKHEKESLELAKSIGIDPTFIYMDDKEGWKISSYVDNIRTPNYDSFEDSKRVLEVLRKLHKKRMSVGWSFKPFENACEIECILKNKLNGISDNNFEELKENVMKCYEKCKDDGVEEIFCHCDTYAPNWMLNDKGDTILIDWEYAGNADPGCDIGTYIMDSMWDVDTAEKFIKEYCKDNYNETLRFHYLAYTAIVSYYWYVWALYREANGAVMGQSLYNWRVMAKRYSDYLVKEFSLSSDKTKLLKKVK